jgi:D-sedoheptulose 7-phosphate isomerase
VIPERLIERIASQSRDSARALETFLTTHAEPLARLAVEVEGRLRRGGKVLAFGNGGSAADAQHLTAEFVGRFLVEREPLPALALSVNSSAVTAIANDYGFERVFERQLRAFARAGDVALGISTSGKSPNVLRALEAAREAGCLTVGLSGGNEGPMGPLCDYIFRTPTAHTPRVQECHIAWVHALCDLVDVLWSRPEEGR